MPFLRLGSARIWLDWPSSILAKPTAVKLYVFPINCWNGFHRVYTVPAICDGIVKGKAVLYNEVLRLC